MEHKGTIQIETERLLLRRFRPDDLEDMYKNCWADPDVWKFTRYKPMKCVEDVINNAGMFTREWFDAYKRPNRYSWAIELKCIGKPIGRMFGMHPDDKEQSVELAYELGKAWWNQGLMTEAVRAVIDSSMRFTEQSRDVMKRYVRGQGLPRSLWRRLKSLCTDIWMDKIPIYTLSWRPSENGTLSRRIKGGARRLCTTAVC